MLMLEIIGRQTAALTGRRHSVVNFNPSHVSLRTNAWFVD